MNNLIPVEHEGQRVLLTSQLAEAYDTTTQIISNNFKRNEERYQEGKHYFVLEGEALKEFKATTGQIVLQSKATTEQFVTPSALTNHQIDDSSDTTTQIELHFKGDHQIDDQFKHTPRLYLWTEKGALLHAKSLNTDKAWEVYDYLVETYFRVKQAVADFSQLSPQLQFLIKLEMEQKRQAAALQAVEQKVDGIRDVVSLDSQTWRTECRSMLNRIAQSLGGGEAYRDLLHECYALVDKRGGVSLETRLTNKRRRMAYEGVCKSSCDKLTKVDVIADDKKLIEIYLAVVKEMAIKYGVA